jgi:3-hydroxybutyryl-CoA dehydrogenase
MAATDLAGGSPEDVVVGVVGAGTMGLGIAQVAAEAGHRVLLHEVDAAVAGRALGRIEEGLRRRARTAVPDEAARRASVAEQLSRVRMADDLDQLAGVSWLVVEAVVEDLEVKRAVFRRLDAGARLDTILATNTSALSVGAVADATNRPGRVIGLHFFNPVPVMRLVEVVAAGPTDGDVVAQVMALMRAWGKTPLRSADAPGFIVNRVNRAYTLEAVSILESSVAEHAHLDRALRGAGYPMGPFELMDLIGIDVNLAVAEAIHQAFLARGDPDADRFRPSETQRRMVAAGRLGRKTSHGFYGYPAPGGGTADTPDAGEDPPAAVLVERVRLAIIAEAYRAAEEGVAARDDIDAALRLGAGHPMGPFELVEEVGGAGRVLDRLRELGRFGPRFSPPQSLVAEAAASRETPWG